MLKLESALDICHRTRDQSVRVKNACDSVVRLSHRLVATSSRPLVVTVCHPSIFYYIVKRAIQIERCEGMMSSDKGRRVGGGGFGDPAPMQVLVSVSART